MSALTLKARLAQLEAKASPYCSGPAVRIIQKGDLTPEQTHLIADGTRAGRLIIVREIVDHVWPAPAYQTAGNLA